MNIKDFLAIFSCPLYTGVPDSQLKSLCNYLIDTFGVSDKHIIAANEGNAVGLAAGYYLAGGGFHDGVAAFPGVVDGVSCIHHNAVQEQATQEVCSLDGRDIAGDADGADTGAKENVPAAQCREALWQGDVSQVGTIVKRS